MLNWWLWGLLERVSSLLPDEKIFVFKKLYDGLCRPFKDDLSEGKHFVQEEGRRSKRHWHRFWSYLSCCKSGMVPVASLQRCACRQENRPAEVVFRGGRLSAETVTALKTDFRVKVRAPGYSHTCQHLKTILSAYSWKQREELLIFLPWCFLHYHDHLSSALTTHKE